MINRRASLASHLKNHLCVRITNQSKRQKSMTMEILKSWTRIDFAWHANDSCDKLAWRLFTHASTDDSTSSWWLSYSNRSSGQGSTVENRFWMLKYFSDFYEGNSILHILAQNHQLSRQSHINLWKFNCLQLFPFFSFVLYLLWKSSTFNELRIT